MVTITKRIKTLVPNGGLTSYKLAKTLASDHVMHTPTGDITLLERYPIDALKKMDDQELRTAIEFYEVCRQQYLTFLPRSTCRWTLRRWISILQRGLVFLDQCLRYNRSYLCIDRGFVYMSPSFNNQILDDERFLNDYDIGVGAVLDILLFHPASRAEE
jgi:hypothetical protein